MSATSTERHMRFMNHLRFFNKRIFNKIMLAFIKTGLGPFTIIQHVGRRSGQTYRTPVFATYSGKNIVIPLSYGDGVDWLRNLQAQGSCRMTHHKESFAAANPEILKAEEALPLLPQGRGKLFARFKVELFLRLTRQDENST